MGKIAGYLKNYSNKSTAQGYQSAVYTFLDNIYGKQRQGKAVTTLEKEVYENFLDQYLSEERNFAEDMAAFAVSLSARPPQAARVTYTYVREFFSHYDLELHKKDQKFIRTKLPKGTTARTVEKDLDIETIRIIIQHVDVKGRALILALASSGMRINEALTLTLDDINLKVKPSEITLRGENTKTGDNRFTFISSEATQAINEWLKVRSEYIRTSTNRNNGLVKSGRGNKKTGEDDGRLFPFSDQNASALWDNSLEKAGILTRDKSTKRKQLHYHQLRKFFISQMSLVVSKEIPETLAGHAGYLTEAYRRYPKKQLAAEYLKAERMVTIQGDADVGKLREDLDTTVKTLQETRNGQEKASSALSSVVIENQGLKEQLNAMINKIQEMQNAAAGHTSEIAELKERTRAISKLVETLMSENVKTQDDKALVHGASVAKSLHRSPRKK